MRALSVILLLLAGGASAATPPNVPPAGVVYLKNKIAYGPYREPPAGSLLPGSTQTMDVTYPAAIEPTGGWPGVVMIHGGSWGLYGQEANYQSWYQFLQFAWGRKVATFSIDYRLVVPGDPSTYWQTQLVDAQLAMRYIRSHAAQFHVNPNKICVIGDSTGAEMALFLAYFKDIAPGDMAGELRGVSPRANCVVADYPPTYYGSGFSQRGAISEAVLDMFKPAYAAVFEPAPTRVVIGTHDNQRHIVSAEELRLALSRLPSPGVPYEYRTFVGGHEFAGLPLAQQDQIYSESLAFILAHIDGK